MSRSFRQHPATIFRRLTDGVVVLALAGDDHADPVFLAGTGGDLWDALAVPHTLAELATLLGERYNQAPERIATDLAPVLDDLLAASILTDESTLTAEPTLTDGAAPPGTGVAPGRGAADNPPPAS